MSLPEWLVCCEGRGWLIHPLRFARQVWSGRSPSADARATASARLETFSLLKSEATWYFTVCSVTNNASAISRFDRPWAMSSRTSRSRAVSGACSGLRRRDRRSRSPPQAHTRPSPRGSALGPPPKQPREPADQQLPGPPQATVRVGPGSAETPRCLRLPRVRSPRQQAEGHALGLPRASRARRVQGAPSGYTGGRGVSRRVRSLPDSGRRPLTRHRVRARGSRGRTRRRVAKLCCPPRGLHGAPPRQTARPHPTRRPTTKVAPGGMQTATHPRACLVTERWITPRRRPRGLPAPLLATGPCRRPRAATRRAPGYCRGGARSPTRVRERRWRRRTPHGRWRETRRRLAPWREVLCRARRRHLLPTQRPLLS